MAMDIAETQTLVHEIARSKGWWEDLDGSNTTLMAAGKLLLMHSEISEAAEELRVSKDAVYFNEDKPDKPEGMVVELADAVIRIMDLCEVMGLDLENAMALKIEYNKTRPHRHGNKAL